MSTTLSPPPLPDSEAPAVAEVIDLDARDAALHASDRPILRALHRLLRALKCWLLAAVGCLSIPGAILFAGWTYTFVQRRALVLWARRLDQPRPLGRTLPRWILAEEVRTTLGTRSRQNPVADWFSRIVRALASSLGRNLRVGFLGVLNSFLITLPGGVLMLFAWHLGWNISFFKGYEQAWIGPTTGFLGIAFFIAAMTYVPIAQARQAITGSGKAFFNYRRVRAVIRCRPLACLLVTAGYTATGAIFMIAVSALMGADLQDYVNTLQKPQIIAFLNSYYFWWAVLFLAPAFLLLKLAAGRIYASATLDLVRDGSWERDKLVGIEREMLADAPVTPAEPPRRGLMTASLRAFTGIGRFTLRTATFLLLFAFAAELYVAQFFNYMPAANWLRQPMVQLPWFHYIPDALKE